VILIYEARRAGLPEVVIPKEADEQHPYGLLSGSFSWVATQQRGLLGPVRAK